MGAVLVTKKTAELYVDDRYSIRAKRESPLIVRLISSLSLAGRRKRVRVGIEDKISLKDFEKLKRDHRGIKWVVTSNLIENLRAVKTPQEIKSIKKAQSINDKIFSAIRKIKLLGMTEIELWQTMERLTIKYGAAGMAFEPVVAFGANAAAAHHLPGKQKIGRNNFLLLDFGVLIKGYHSDFTRTLFMGSPNKKQEKVYRTVLEAQDRGIKEIRAMGDRIRQAAGLLAVRIDHIGSTSVPGLAAKPLIDIQVSVNDLYSVDAYRKPLEAGRVRLASEHGPHQDVFHEAPGDRRTHIHVVKAGSFVEQFTLLVRDYLRVTPTRSTEYAALKYELAHYYLDQDPAPRDPLKRSPQPHTDRKGPFVLETVRRAYEWSFEAGWQAGDSDA